MLEPIDEDTMALLAAPKLTRQLSDKARRLLAGLSLETPPDGPVSTPLGASSSDEPPPPVPLRRTLTKGSGDVFDRFAASNPTGHETAAGILSRAANAAVSGQLSLAGKQAVQRVLLAQGTKAAVEELDRRLVAGPDPRPAAAAGVRGAALGFAPGGFTDPSSPQKAASAEAPKKKKKKLSGYAAMMANITAPTASEDDKKRELEEKMKQGLGGGQFSKLDRI